MTTEPERGEYPEEEFEIVEVDVTPYLTDEQKSWPVVRCESAEQEFAIEEPLPALDVRLGNSVLVTEGLLPALVRALSNQEAALGGTGLDVSRQVTENGRTRTTLVPRSVEGARERLERVAQWAAWALGSETAVTAV
jgi:hypothetical protein